MAGARRFFVKVYNDGGRFGGIKNSSRSSLQKDQRCCRVSSGDALQPNDKITGLWVWTPRGRSHLSRSAPLLDFPSNDDFPKADRSIFAGANYPCSVWAGADTTDPGSPMTKAKGLVRGERFKATWAGEFGDQTIRVYSKLSPLDSGGKVEVKLPTESLLNKLIIGGDQA